MKIVEYYYLKMEGPRNIRTPHASRSGVGIGHSPLNLNFNHVGVLDEEWNKHCVSYGPLDDQDIDTPIKCQKCDSITYVFKITTIISVCRDCVKELLTPPPTTCYICNDTTPSDKCVKIDTVKGVRMGICGVCIRDNLMYIFARRTTLIKK